MSFKNTPRRKRFGQHFLEDSRVIDMIVSAAELDKRDHVLEIGPGRGDLTEHLLSQGSAIHAVEIDRNLVHFLNKKFKHHENFQISEGDILKLPWEPLVAANKTNKIVSNLPYNVSAPIFFEMLKNRSSFERVVIMVQKEVADRLLHQGEKTKRKDYGILSVAATVFFDVEWVCDVPPEAFNPPPKVSSTVLRLWPKDSEIDEEQEFLKFIRQAFQQRRKVFLRRFREFDPERFSLLDKNTLDYLEKLRPEDLRPSDYIQLFLQGRLSRNQPCAIK